MGLVVEVVLNCAMGRRGTARLVVLALGVLGVLACSVDASTSKESPTAADAGDAAGPPVLAVAGCFFDVPGQPTSATYAARLFYVFQPADADAAHKPIVVLSNGGPGAATSAGLLAHGTGRGDTPRREAVDMARRPLCVRRRRVSASRHREAGPGAAAAGGRRSRGRRFLLGALSAARPVRAPLEEAHGWSHGPSHELNPTRPKPC